tara:strand:- start:1289 stop:2125 length:837 start_codon:yes stop_codon:yes gene_type:complete
MERFAFRAPSSSSSSSSSRGCFGKEKIVLRRRFGTTTNQSHAARRDNKSTRGQTTTTTMIRAGFLEEAFERAQQKSSEVEETLRSMQQKSLLPSFTTSSGVKVEDMKGALLSKISTVERGAVATEEDKEEIDALARNVENTQKRKNALESKFINGKWELMYTTSASILGLSKPKLFRPSGPIYQTIDAKNLRAFNSESAPFYNQVSAELTPTTKSSVDVQFKKFGLFSGLIKINAPESAKGKLDTTYVDEELRISRGDKGNLFVLLMRDPSATLDVEY